MRVYDFTDTIGVNTHLPYTDGCYGNWPNTLAALQYIGVKHIRDAAPKTGGTGQTALAKAVDAGFRLSAVSAGGRAIADTIADLCAFVTAHPGGVAQVEGPNEVNNNPLTYGALKDRQTHVPGSNYYWAYPATLAFKADLRAAMTAAPSLAALRLLDAVGLPPMQVATCDIGNAHPYPAGGVQPAARVKSELTNIATMHPGMAAQFTEFGYHTLTTKPNGVAPDTAATLLLNGLGDAALAGVARTYLYQLLDAYSDPGAASVEKHWGLFDTSFAPKPAATALRNLIQILADPDPAAGTHMVKAAAVGIYSANGAKATGISRLDLTRADGATLMLLWREVPVWNAAGACAIPVAAVPLTLTFSKSTAVRVFTPALDCAPGATCTGKNAKLSLAERMMVVELQ